MCNLDVSAGGRSMCPGGHVAAGVVLVGAGLVFDAVHRILHSSTPAPVAAPDPANDLIVGAVVATVIVIALIVAAVAVRHLRAPAQPRLRPLTPRSVVPATRSRVALPVEPTGSAPEAVQVQHEGATMVLTAEGVEKVPA